MRFFINTYFEFNNLPNWSDKLIDNLWMYSEDTKSLITLTSILHLSSFNWFIVFKNYKTDMVASSGPYSFCILSFIFSISNIKVLSLFSIYKF